MKVMHDDHSEGGAARRVAGRVTVLAGCMFSGKTAALLSDLEACPAWRCVAFKHVSNDRYAAGAIVSHTGRKRPAVAVSAPEELLEHIGDGVVRVGVDDAHFFDPSLASVAVRLARTGVGVTLTTLNLDSWGRPMAVADALRAHGGCEIIMRGRCARCGRRADRTQRLTPIENGRMVGGAGDYEPRCAACWHPPSEAPPLVQQVPAGFQMMSRASKMGPSVQQRR